MKCCPKLTRLNNITYASKNLFTSHSSCDIAVTWQAIHEVDDIFGCANAASRKSLIATGHLL